MSINPYLKTRQEVLANKQTQSQAGKRLLYDKSTLLREATMAKAAQIQKLKQAAGLGDANAREMLASRQKEFNEQLGHINELDQLKSLQLRNQIEQLRKCFIRIA